jgi:hydroxyethylthiazole kinase-like uncharacterized protein yjeF
MQALDRAAIEQRGIPGLALMESAGRGIVAAMERQFGSLAGLSPLVVCGKGNNGGDGFVVTRLLIEKGATPDCILLGRAAELKGDAAANWQRLGHLGFTVTEAESAADVRTLFSGRRHIVDAIFGTGLTRAPSGLSADVIRLINLSGAHVTSVDLPSGLGSDTGIPFDPCVRADLTVTMALPKLGLWLYPGRALAGRLEVVDIGIPPDLSAGGDMFLIDGEAVRQILPRRRPDGHKGTFGTALIIAGSRGFSGAVCLAGLAAVRSGCGLARLAIPSGIADIVESRCLEPVKTCLPQTDAEAIGPQALPAVGPGIGTDAQTREFELALLPRLSGPVVVDADGLNNLAGSLAVLGQSKARFVLTPHPGEFSRLTGLKPEEINADRVGVARKFATDHKVVLVLKGASTVVAAPDGRVFVNPTGNSGLASGGTGDVLTGLLCGLLAQGMEPLDASLCAVFLHGLAGDLGAADLTEYCLCAGDLLDYLPGAFNSVLHGE